MWILSVWNRGPDSFALLEPKNLGQCKTPLWYIISLTIACDFGGIGPGQLTLSSLTIACAFSGIGPGQPTFFQFYVHTHTIHTKFEIQPTTLRPQTHNQPIYGYILSHLYLGVMQ